MKKIFTLLFSVGVVATSFAQTGLHQTDKKEQYVTNNEYKKIDSRRDNIYTFSAKEKDMQIDKINKEYNFKVASIKSNKHISKRDKKMLIQKAHTSKTQQLAKVNSKFNSKFNSAYNIHAKQYDGHKQ